MFLVTFYKASVGRHDIAYEKKDRIVEKICPGMRSMKEAPQTDPHEDQWNQEQEYAAPTIAPIRQSCDHLGIFQVPVQLIEETAAVKDKDSQRCYHPHPINIVPSFLHDFVTF